MPARRPIPATALRYAALGVMLLGTSGLAAPQHAGAQLIDSLRARVEKAVVQDAGAELDLVIARLRLEAREAPEHRVLQYDLGYALYRRAHALSQVGRSEEARKLLEEADRALARALSLGIGGGALALRGAVSSDLAKVSGMVAAMRLEPLAFRQLDQALLLAPEDPRVALLNGIARLGAPRALGGGIDEGERELRRAVRLFEADSSASPAPTWGHADAHIWLGIALTRRGLTEEAKASFERALELAPGHSWVKSTLLPQATAKSATREPAGSR